jgi:predicted DNA binding protein
MPTGIRATVEFDDPDICPITALSAAAETTVESVTSSVRTVPDAESTMEFTVADDGDCEGHADDARLERIFAHGQTSRYRLTHEEGVSCPCACLGQFGCSPARYVAREGTLTLVFHAADYEELEAVVAALRDRFPAADITRFIRSPTDADTEDLTLVDRSKLTPRQLEVLETAHEMGYFERPRRANATDVADELDINPSTFGEHLSAAERKLLDDLL